MKLSKLAFIIVRNRIFIRIMIIKYAKTKKGERISENSKARKILHNATNGRIKQMKYNDSVTFCTVNLNNLLDGFASDFSFCEFNLR